MQTLAWLKTHTLYKIKMTTKRREINLHVTGTSTYTYMYNNVFHVIPCSNFSLPKIAHTASTSLVRTGWTSTSLLPSTEAELPLFQSIAEPATSVPVLMIPTNVPNPKSLPRTSNSLPVLSLRVHKSFVKPSQNAFLSKVASFNAVPISHCTSPSKHIYVVQKMDETLDIESVKTISASSLSTTKSQSLSQLFTRKPKLSSVKDTKRTSICSGG